MCLPQTLIWEFTFKVGHVAMYGYGCMERVEQHNIDGKHVCDYSYSCMDVAQMVECSLSMREVQNKNFGVGMDLSFYVILL